MPKINKTDWKHQFSVEKFKEKVGLVRVLKNKILKH